jgi:hypothetical protein
VPQFGPHGATDRSLPGSQEEQQTRTSQIVATLRRTPEKPTSAADPGGERRPECAGKSAPAGFELPELVQQDEVAAFGDIALHRYGGSDSADPIEVAIRHTRAQIVEDRIPCFGREVPQITGLTMPIRQPMAVRDEAGH